MTGEEEVAGRGANPGPAGEDRHDHSAGCAEPLEHFPSDRNLFPIYRMIRM